jgi:hypothetical protein
MEMVTIIMQKVTGIQEVQAFKRRNKQRSGSAASWLAGNDRTARCFVKH